jgi:hypothetical protein
MDLQNKVISISDISIEEKRIKINDQDKKVFSIWRTKSDGTPTKAIGQFQPYVMSHTGKSFEISYSEKPNPQNEGTFFRNIVMIKEVNPNGTERPEGVHEPTNDLNTRLSRIETDIAFIKGKLGMQESGGLPTETIEDVPPPEEEIGLEDLNF